MPGINKKLIHTAITLFSSVVLVAVLLHSVVFERGFNTNWTISRYMGTDHWSAILFAVVNFIIIALVLKYFIQVKKAYRLSAFWLTGIIVMLIAYFGLSCCPIGLFDDVWGHFGPVSSIHHIFSTTLFTAMIVIAIDTLIEIKNRTHLLVYGILLLAYAAFCTVGYLGKINFFMSNVFFFETGYIVANLFLYALIPRET